MSQNLLRSVFLFSKKVIVISFKTTFNVAMEARRELVKQVREYNLKEKREVEFEAFKKIAEAASKSKILDSSIDPSQKILNKMQAPEVSNVEKINQTQILLDKILKETTTSPSELEKKNVNKVKSDDIIGKVDLKPQKILDGKTNTPKIEKSASEIMTNVDSKLLDTFLEEQKNRYIEKMYTESKDDSIKNIREESTTLSPTTKTVFFKESPSKVSETGQKTENSKIGFSMKKTDVTGLKTKEILKNHLKQDNLKTIPKKVQSLKKHDISNVHTNLYDDVIKDILLKAEIQNVDKQETLKLNPNDNILKQENEMKLNPEDMTIKVRKVVCKCNEFPHLHYNEDRIGKIVLTVLDKKYEPGTIKSNAYSYDEVIKNILEKNEVNLNTKNKVDCELFSHLPSDEYIGKVVLRLQKITVEETTTINLDDYNESRYYEPEYSVCSGKNHMINNISMTLSKNYSFNCNSKVTEAKIKLDNLLVNNSDNKETKVNCNEFPYLHHKKSIGKIVLTKSGSIKKIIQGVKKESQMDMKNKTFNVNSDKRFKVIASGEKTGKES